MSLQGTVSVPCSKFARKSEQECRRLARAASWQKVRGERERAERAVGASTAGSEEPGAGEGSRVALQDRGHVTGTRGLHKDAAFRWRAEPEL